MVATAAKAVATCAPENSPSLQQLGERQRHGKPRTPDQGYRIDVIVCVRAVTFKREKGNCRDGREVCFRATV